MNLPDYQITPGYQPLFVCSSAADILPQFPPQSFDFCMTSPPYWNKREYESGGIGLETSLDDYTGHLLDVFAEVKRVLKNTGSFWLNLGDSYRNKGLMGIPWRIALALVDQQGWVLRNDVIWNKLKSPDNTRDKLRNTHEYVFHFVKHPKGFFYDVDAIRAKPRSARVKNGAIISATGVSGVRYKRRIALSTSLNDIEKQNATTALEQMLFRIQNGEIADYG